MLTLSLRAVNTTRLVLPHLLIEYSANIEDRMDLDGLLDKLYDAALTTGVFPLGGIRIRAFRAAVYRIGDCRPDNAYVHVTAMIGHGRSLEVRRQVGETLFAAITEHLEPLYESSPLAISFNIQEFHPELNFKKNNLHERIEARRQ